MTGKFGGNVKLHSLLTSASFFVMGAHSALAQEAKIEPDLGDIVVTAQKTAAPLQKISVAATSLDSSALDKNGVKTVADLDGYAPGVAISKNQGFQRIITIRGVGFEANQNDSAQPGVSYSIDGVYIASPLMLSGGFVDVKRIEIIRGPQGTVFGQNSTGGAINVVNKGAQLGAASLDGDVSYGSYNLTRLRANANFPVGEYVAIRASVDRSSHDGWAKATAVPGQPGYELDDDDSISSRIQVLYQPTDAFSAKLWGQYYDISVHGAAQKNIIDPDPDPRRLSQNYPSVYRAHSWVAAGDLTYEFSGMTLRSLTSYQKTHVFTAQDFDKLTDAQSLAAYGVTDVVPKIQRDPEAFTQEIDLSGTWKDRLQWILGAFYLNQRSHQQFYEYQQAAGQIGLPIDTPREASVGEFFTLLGNGLAFQTDSVQKRRSFSVYGQGTYDLTDDSRITTGVRWTTDRSKASVENFWGYDFTGTDNGPQKLATGDDSFTGKISLERDWAQAKMLYLSLANGLKAGGTSLNPTSIVVPSTFKPERVNAIELGSKNTLFNGRARLNVAAFYNFYKNFQFQAEDPIPYGGGVDNIPKVETWGLELEGAAFLPAGFRVDGNVALLDGEIKSDFLALDSVIANEVNRAAIASGDFIFSGANIAARAAASTNLKGNTPPKLPGFTTMLALGHTLDLHDAGELETRLQFQYRSGFEYRVYNHPVADDVPSMKQFNFNIRYTPIKKNWYAEFSALNFTDEDGVNSLYSDAFGVGETSREYIPPQQFIGKVGFSF